MEQKRKEEEKRQKLIQQEEERKRQQQQQQQQLEEARLKKEFEEKKRKDQEMLLKKQKEEEEAEKKKSLVAAAVMTTVHHQLSDSKPAVLASLPAAPPPPPKVQPALPPVYMSAMPYCAPPKVAYAAATTPYSTSPAFFSFANPQQQQQQHVTPSPNVHVVQTQPQQAHVSTVKIVPPTPAVGAAPQPTTTTTTVPGLPQVTSASAETVQSNTNAATNTMFVASNPTMPPTPATTQHMTQCAPPPHPNPGVLSYPQSQSYSYWNPAYMQQLSLQPQQQGHSNNYQHHYAYGGSAAHQPANLLQNHSWYGYYQAQQQQYQYQYHHHQNPHPAVPTAYPHQQHYYNSSPSPYYGASHCSYSQQQQHYAAFQQQPHYNTNYFLHQHHHHRGPVVPALRANNNKTEPSSPRTTNSNQLYSNLLSDAMKPPSHFASTHVLLSEPIVLIKKPGEAYGLSLGTDRKSTLVEPEWIENYMKQLSEKINKDSSNKTGTEQDSSSATSTETRADEAINDAVPANVTTTNKRRRRRRFFFSAMSILDAQVQNQRLIAAAQANNESSGAHQQLVEEGDILISINGQSVAGKSFTDACTLFNSQDDSLVGKDGFVRCLVTVARKLVVQQPPKTLPTPVSTLATVKTPQQQTQEGLSAPVVSESDMATFAATLIKAIMDRPVLSEKVLLSACVQLEPSLAGKSLDALMTTWKKVEQEMYVRMMTRSGEHWKKEWENLPLPHFTDAQLHEMRFAPRPLKGCKCGSQDHEYVDDPICPLYRNLRRLDDDEADDADAKKNGKLAKKITQLQRDLKPVQSAFVKRIMRETGEKNAEQAEARFVARMEEIQLHKCNKAVFAPSLPAAVLSAVVEMREPKGGGGGNSTLLPTIESENTMLNETSNDNANNKCESDDSDDDDDDVPLAALGKRSAQSLDQNSKKQKVNVHTISNQYLATVVRFISQRWGHVMKEPSAMDYAWRWELYHGQTTGAEGNKFWNNPRGPGSLSLENTHFLLDDKVVANVVEPCPTAASGERDKALKTITYVLQTNAAGIVDEALALVRMGVLEISDGGILQLAGEWYANVDILLLSDMAENWGISVDPEGRYGVSDEIRNVLLKEWIQNEEGSWSYSSDPDDIVYVSSDFAMWREAFEHKNENRSAGNEGIGRFGI